MRMRRRREQEPRTIIESIPAFGRFRPFWAKSTTSSSWKQPSNTGFDPINDIKNRFWNSFLGQSYNWACTWVPFGSCKTCLQMVFLPSKTDSDSSLEGRKQPTNTGFDPVNDIKNRFRILFYGQSYNVHLITKSFDPILTFRKTNRSWTFQVHFERQTGRQT